VSLTRARANESSANAEIPAAFPIAGTATALFLFCAILSPDAASIPAAIQLAIVAIIAGIGASLVRPRASLAIAGIAWLMLNGFLVDRYGDLRWHGGADLVRLLAMVGICLAASWLGTHQRKASPRT